MTKVSETVTSKIKNGTRVEFDNKEFVLMLDKEGNERIGSRGKLVKYGRVSREGTIRSVREDKVELKLDHRPYYQWIKHTDMLNLKVL